MKPKELKIFIALAAFVVIPELHLIMNSWEPHKVDWILFCEKSQDIQWYAKHNLDILALTALSWAMVLGAPIKLKPLAKGVLIMNVIKLPLYWLFYLQFDWAINSTIFIIAYLIYFSNEKRNHDR